MALSPDGAKLFVANIASGSISVINTATSAVTTTITLSSVSNVDFTPDGARAYATANGSNAGVAIIEASPGSSLLTVAAGGKLTSSTTGPLIKLAGTVDIGKAIVELAGRTTNTTTEVADGVTLTLGADQPLSSGSSLVELNGATVNSQRGLVLDTALLAASAPILDLKAAPRLTTAIDTIDLVQKAKLTSVGPVVLLDAASRLTVTAGALIRVAGGSLLRVTGDLIQVNGGSTLNVNNGPLVTVTGASVLNVSGALLGFSGSGNAATVSNTLCSSVCPTVGSIPVFLTNGASTSQISVGGTPIRGGTITTAPATGGRTAVIAVDGTASRVTISGQ